MTNNEPRAMQEIHDIRLQIYEETKDLTDEQRAERTRNAVKEMEELYGIKFKRPATVNTRKAM